MTDSMSGQLKRFDAYAKTLDDFRIRTISGGFVTIISSILIFILFFIELNYFLSTDVVQVLFVDTSRQEKMNITLDLKFPALPCSQLTVDAMDVSGDSQTDIIHNLFKTRLDLNGHPIENEVTKILLQPIPKLNNTKLNDDKLESTTRAECESCYGAESAVQKCCPTCDDVKQAYRVKGWSFVPGGIHQCVREGITSDTPGSHPEVKLDEGCRLHGHLEVNKVAGNFHIAPGHSFQQQHVHIHSLQNLRLNQLNTSHLIDVLTFGERFPNQINPLAKTKQITSSHDNGAVLFHYYVKVVPSTYVFLNGTELLTNQYSVTKHKKIIKNIFDSTDQQLPGAFFTYEISAIMVKFVEQKRSLARFLTSLCAIIGGVFTVSSLIDAFVYRSSCLLHKQGELGKINMRFRQLINPTYKNLYDVCLNQAPFYQNEVIEEIRPDHNYCRPWIDDPTIPTALPRVQLFFNSNLIDDLQIDIDNSLERNEENLEKISWAPMIKTLIPEKYEFLQQSDEILTSEQDKFIQNIRQLIDETRIATLCCETNTSDVVYWRLSIHNIVARLFSLLNRQPDHENLLDWLHEYICKTFDRIFIGHYVDLFQILYYEYPDMRALFTEKPKSWPTTSLCSYVYNKLLQKPNDLTEEVIYSITLSSLSIPTIFLLIPGLAYEGHMERVQFWQRNLSQVSTVMLTEAIEKDSKSEQEQVQTVYEDILTKFNEVRQIYPNHHIIFLGWNVGCILALKAALVCSVSSIICMSPPYLALSEESKNDFTQINASILFITGERQHSNQIDQYRQRLKSRNGLIELGGCNDKLCMSEDGKYRFRLIQRLIDKLLMEEILDFFILISPKTARNICEDVDEDNRKKKSERIHSATSSHMEDSNDPFLYMGSNANSNALTTLTIPPEQDPNSIFINTVPPTMSTSRKRKGSTLTNSADKDRLTTTQTTNSTGAKRGRHRTKNLPPPSTDMEWAPSNEKRPVKTTTKKAKQTMPPTATTSILNTLLQLPSNQPKQRTNETNLIKPVHQPPSFVNTVLSSNSFL
ncbi:hypothetical protein I4U23_013540 [Adineta vaga]|nr:hypothetical protein I4U23_013540 [Adineta vaga]